MRIDNEILEAEQRIGARQEALKQAARESGRGALDALVSPWGLAAAVALGFYAGGGAGRRQPREGKKRFALGSLLATGAMWLIRERFGGPMALAELALSKVKKTGA